MYISKQTILSSSANYLRVPSWKRSARSRFQVNHDVIIGRIKSDGDLDRRATEQQTDLPASSAHRIIRHSNRLDHFLQRSRLSIQHRFACSRDTCLTVQL